MSGWHWQLKDDQRSLALETTMPVRKPWLRVEGASPFQLRWVAGDRPFLWVSVEDGRWFWTGTHFLRAAEPPGDLLPPWHADTLREVMAAPRSSEWWAYWLRKTADRVTSSEFSPLYGLRWRLSTVEQNPNPLRYPTRPGSWDERQPEIPAAISSALKCEQAWSEDWDFGFPPGAVIGLRAIGATDAGRVKAWRKRVRDETCPPILLLYFAFARKYLLVDGHVRLAAALEEGTLPPMLGLWPERIVTRDPGGDATILRGADELIRAWAGPPGAEVHATNRYLLANYKPLPPLVRSLVWPMRGGISQWRREVSQRLTEIDVEKDLVEMLLRPRGERQ